MPHRVMWIENEHNILITHRLMRNISHVYLLLHTWIKYHVLISFSVQREVHSNKQQYVAISVSAHTNQMVKYKQAILWVILTNPF